MPFEILDKETEKSISEITGLIKLRKNGVTADAMRDAGIQYKLNFGVSVVHLREIAKNYPPNNKLAKALWNLQWRETMFLATLLFENGEADKDFLNKIATEASTEELYQQIGMNIVANINNAVNVCESFVSSNVLSKRAIACYGIYRYMMYHPDDAVFADKVVQKMLESPIVNDTSWTEINALGKALAKAGYVSSVENSVILNFFTLRASIHKYWGIVEESVRSEFEYR